MKNIKMLAFILALLSVSFTFAQNKPGTLAFKQGDDEFILGFLAGWGGGEGYGAPIVWERGAFGGMFSFGAEVRMWWYNYRRYGGSWWEQGYWNGYPVVWNGDYQSWGYWYNARFYPVWQYDGRYYLIDANGNPYIPADRKFTKFGFSSSFRTAFHPFGIPALKGQVKIANVLDPYVGLKIGFSVINWDRDDPFILDRREFHFPAFGGFAGIRYYFRENVSIWTEFSNYDFSVGLSLNL
jgi:hypothetical protein